MWGGFVSQASLNHVPLRLFKNAYFGVAGGMASGAAAREQTGSSTRRRTGDHASYGVTLGSSTHRSWEHAFTRNLVHGCSRQHHSSASQSENNQSVHQMMNGFLTMWYIHTGEYYSAIKKECSKKLKKKGTGTDTGYNMDGPWNVTLRERSQSQRCRVDCIYMKSPERLLLRDRKWISGCQGLAGTMGARLLPGVIKTTWNQVVVTPHSPVDMPETTAVGRIAQAMPRRVGTRSH